MQDTSVYWGILQFQTLILCCHCRKPCPSTVRPRVLACPCHYLAWPCSPACGLCPGVWGAGRGAGLTAGGTASSARAAGTASHPTASSSTAPGCTCRHPCLSTCWTESSVKHCSKNNSQSEHLPTAALHQIAHGAALEDRELSRFFVPLTHLGTWITPGSLQHDTLQPPFPAIFLLFYLF